MSGFAKIHDDGYSLPYIRRRATRHLGMECRAHGPTHADAYVRYLKHRIGHLATIHAKGKPVAIRPDLRYVLVRRKSNGHGHLVVYRVQGKEVHVLHIFQTAQDWQTTLAREN